MAAVPENHSESHHPAPKVKICGITSTADAEASFSAGAYFLGFIFVEGTPRYISPAQAAKIVSDVPGPAYTGVFMDIPSAKVNRIANECALHYVQLHGIESTQYCSEIEIPVIKAFRVKPEMTEADVRAMIYPYRLVADYLLLDAWDKHEAGGTGKTFDWQIAANLSKEFNIMLAGGLNPDNVARATGLIKPKAIDLSSGVEVSPGKKDHAKILKLFKALQEEN